jgi:hypothetical protein
MRLTLVSLSVALAVMLAAPATHAADSCIGGCPKPPKTTHWLSATSIPLAAFGGNVLSASLLKGKKKTVIEVEGLLTDGPYTPFFAPRVFSLGTSVNGLPMQPAAAPGFFEVITDCGAFSDSNGDTPGIAACTVSGHWWLDMEDPANAGLLGVPLTVTLVGGDLIAGPEVGGPVDMSLRVRVVKKK